MFITKDFVLLNFPKTGSSFTREVLKRIHRKRDKGLKKYLIRAGLVPASLQTLRLPSLNIRHEKYVYKDQHGKFFQIPDEHKHKLIVSNIRNPFSRMISTYHFRWWAKYPPAPIEKIKERFPKYPDLKFKDYYYMMQELALQDRLCGLKPAITIGNLSFRFILFFYPDPKAIINKISPDYIGEKARQDLPRIHFLHQENLNQELADFLRSMRYSRKEIRTIDRMEKINVTPKEPHEKNKQPSDYFDAELTGDLLHRERFFFALFPEYLPENTQAQYINTSLKETS